MSESSSQSRNSRSAKTPPQNNSDSRGLALALTFKELGVAAAFFMGCLLFLRHSSIRFAQVLDTFSAEGIPKAFGTAIARHEGRKGLCRWPYYV